MVAAQRCHHFYFKNSSIMTRVSKEAQLELLDMDESKSAVVEIPRTGRLHISGIEKINGKWYKLRLKKTMSSNETCKVGFQKPYTTARLSREFIKNEASKELKEGLDTADFMASKMKAVHKFSSYIILNNFWKIIFFHSIMWRWLYYVKQYDYAQLLPIVAEGKKKMDSAAYYVSMALAMTMMTTMKNLTKKEAEQYQAELSSEQDQHSAKSTLGL